MSWLRRRERIGFRFVDADEFETSNFGPARCRRLPSVTRQPQSNKHIIERFVVASVPRPFLIACSDQLLYFLSKHILKYSENLVLSPGTCAAFSKRQLVEIQRFVVENTKGRSKVVSLWHSRRPAFSATQERAKHFSPNWIVGFEP